MMGGKTPEKCWAVSKRQDNKLENFCVWLVIYLNCSWWFIWNVWKCTDLQTLNTWVISFWMNVLF
jgi:hypothetical protein